MKRIRIHKHPVGWIILVGLILSNCQTFRSPYAVSPAQGSYFPKIEVVPPPPSEAVVCDAADDCLTRAVASDKNGRREDARNALTALMEKYSATAASRRAAFLLAKWAVEEKIPLEERWIAELKAGGPEMGDYVEKLEADDAFNRGEDGAADRLYSHILVLNPSTVLRPQILVQLGKTRLRMKDYDGSAEMLSLFLRENPKDEKVPEVAAGLFDLYADTENWEKGARIYRELELKFPDAPPCAEVEKKVARLNLSRADRERFRLLPQEQFIQGKSLFEIGRFEKAMEIWKGIRQKGGAEQPYLPEMELKMGLASIPLKKISDAKDYFERVLKKYPQSESAPEAMLGLARVASREEDEAALLKLRKRAEKFFGKNEAYGKLLYMIGIYYEEHHRSDEAHRYYRSIVSDLPQNSVTPDALWRDGWTSYKEGDNASVRKNLSALLSGFPSSPLTAQAIYWRARASERDGNPGDAQEEFRRLCQLFNHSYYCHLARKRLTADSDAREDSAFLPASAADSASQAGAFQQDEHYVKAKELMAMGLTQEASKEFNYLAERNRDKGSLLQIDRELVQAGDFYHALKSLKGQFPDVLDRGRSFEPVLIWDIAYPKGAVEKIRNIAREARIEPEFAAGIMREESVFDVRATSRSGAIGLMQLMPFTGEWVSQKLGMSPFAKEKLYDQELNIRFGVYYLDYLRDLFDGNLYYTAASYNAGPDAVNKWIVNGHFSDLEEFVENIPYQETRYYVKRVMKSYEEFKESRLRPDDRGSRSLPVDNVSLTR